MPQLPSRLRRARRNLHLPATLAGAMFEEGWRHWPQETGGILLGRQPTNAAHIVSVIGPGPQALHERYGFTPDSDWQAKQVADAWAHDPTLHYLGDWHTHPGGTTRFSRLDQETANSFAAHTDARQPEPCMLVFALGHDLSSQVAAAQLFKGQLHPVALKLVATDDASDADN